jgi:hypothetical protein
MNKKTIVAIIATTIWIASGAILVSLRIDEVKSLQLNAVGDFLAGFFSPIAFLWLVFGYFQQGEELSLNTQALELQVKELRRSVEHQRDLVDITREDLQLSKNEFERERDESIRNAQPALHFKVGSYSIGGRGIANLTAKVVNSGHPATRILIRSPIGEVSPKSIVMLGRGENCSLHFDFTASPMQNGEFSIQYDDGIGKVHHQNIGITKDATGAIEFLPPVEVYPTDC